MENKNKMMMIIIIVLLLVLIGAVVGLAVFSIQALRKSPEEANSNKSTVEQVIQLSQDDITLVKLSSPINTNLLTGPDGIEHSIRVSISIGVNKKEKTSDAFIATLQEKESVIRDRALSVIQTKTFQEIRRPDGQEILRSDIKTKLQEEFNSNLIVEVYIEDMLTN